MRAGRRARWVLGLLLVLASHAGAAPRIAVIIDDLGYNPARDDAVITLPAPVTCSVIPAAPYAHRAGFRAYLHGKEVMIHLPMPAVGRGKPDAGGIDGTMSTAQMGAVIERAMRVLPEAWGLNNHMGSALTAQPAPMRRLMAALRARHLFFIDSRTSAATVAESTARQMGVRTGRRNVFLDDRRNAASIDRQFQRLLSLARRHGHAIAIGHPYPETVRYLQRALPKLERAGIEVVPVSALLPPVGHRDGAVTVR